jgi:DNA polymerase-3 subunit epsilon
VEIKKRKSVDILNGMKTIFFDTETTGLCPGQICQLSYIIVNEKQIIGKNFYFTVAYIEPRAHRIHKLTVQKLSGISNCLTFRDHSKEIHNDFSNTETVAGHNIDFDMKFLTAELSRCGYILQIPQSYCCMKQFINVIGICGKERKYKYPSLKELVKFFAINDKKILEYCKLYFRAEDIRYHDARYDATAVMLCYQKMTTGNGEIYDFYCSKNT